MERHPRDRRRDPVDGLECGRLFLPGGNDDLARNAVETRQSCSGRSMLPINDGKLATFDGRDDNRRETRPSEGPRIRSTLRRPLPRIGLW
jgi:hypothetical protein